MFKSSSSKHISKAVWETLSRARFANEKLAWEGEVESKDDVFFMPPKSPIREDPIPRVVLNTQVHLEVNEIVHAYIVKQLTNFLIVHFLGSHITKQSRFKNSWKCVKIIKIGDKISPSLPPRCDHS